MSKLIRIIKGVYGHKNGLTTIPKTSKDKPFTVDDKIAQRLIAHGIAEIATETKTEAEPVEKYSINLAKQETKEIVVNKADKPEAPAPAEDEVAEQVVEAEAEYSENNTKDELLAYLEGTGYEVTSATKRLNKAEIIALIDEQLAPEVEAEDEGDAPSFEEDGVVE